MKIFVVVPAYNEEKRLKKVLRDLKKIKLPIIVVDDGSEDNTYDVARKTHGVLVVRHSINIGKGAALKTGCEAAFKAGGDAVVLIDSDGQHKVEDIQPFLKKIKSGEFDIVFGSRNLGLGAPFVRFMGNKLVSVFVNLLFGIYVSDVLCGFRALTKKAYKKINWESSNYSVETEMVIKTGKNKLKYCEVPVQTVYYDEFKGVSLLDTFSVFFDILRWRVKT